MKQGDTFIPYHVFNGHYREVLSSVDALTRSEKRLLIVLNAYSFKDGMCFPCQMSIADKLGQKKYGGRGKPYSVRQVQNIQISLERKGYLKVIRPDIRDRRTLCKTNQYFFLWSDAYVNISPEISYETSPEISHDTPINKQVIKSPSPQKNAAASFCKLSMADQSEASEKEIISQINAVCESIDIDGFDAHQFAAWAMNNFIQWPVDAVLDAVTGIKSKLNNSSDKLIKELRPWGYGISIIQRQGPMYCERKEIDNHRAVKAEFDKFYSSNPYPFAGTLKRV